MQFSPHPAIVAMQERALASLQAAGIMLDADAQACIASLAVASDFAINTLQQQPELLQHVLSDASAVPIAPPVLDADNRGDWAMLLRRHRHAESTRLIWRDVIAGDAVESILAGSSALADQCLQIALQALEREFERRHGVVRDEHGAAQRLVVFGLGKLGGGELNFSSDVDLVYAYPEDGDSDGARSLAAEDYFARLGQQLAKLLDEVTADGFCHRVDLRLRPYGNAGRIAWSFSALEQYFQREGRDWERYAWQKARPVAGDIEAGEEFLRVLRPFVYRRYLDYGAMDGLRAMKAMIDAEVQRHDMCDDIKRGPGGIREIEFLAQALQLIRGGREPQLQQRGLLASLAALVDARHLRADVGARMAQAYRCLRTLENRLQMLHDAQTHELPQDEVTRLRIAMGLGYADWGALQAALQVQRDAVSVEFAALLSQRERTAAPSALDDYWSALPESGDPAALAASGFADIAALDEAMRDFARAHGVRELSDATRARLDRVMPALLRAAAAASQPDIALRRVLGLLHNILRRSSYLALLDEQPAALARLVDVVSRSALLAERVCTHPLLLDELLDARNDELHFTHSSILAECEAASANHDRDVESTLRALNEKRHAISFRIGLACLDGRMSAVDTARALAWLADAVVQIVQRVAEQEIAQAHGCIPNARFAILGYGSLGGEELGFGSDLDLVFLYDIAGAANDDHPMTSEGPRPLDAARWHARLAQKIVALLGVETGAGRLFDVDVRLRPDGASGLLVSSLESYAQYQRERAWTWEHQALVRARCVCGDVALHAEFERVRHEVLLRERPLQQLQDDVSNMRIKMRAELDRSDASGFDLKQGVGGLVDLEFLLQFLVLRDASRNPALLQPRDTPTLITTLQECGSIDVVQATSLQEAHAALLAAGLACTLDRRKRWIVPDASIESARAAIRAACATQGLRMA